MRNPKRAHQFFQREVCCGGSLRFNASTRHGWTRIWLRCGDGYRHAENFYVHAAQRGTKIPFIAHDLRRRADRSTWAVKMVETRGIQSQ